MNNLVQTLPSRTATDIVRPELAPTTMYERRVKRVLDIGISVTLLLVGLPVISVLALSVRVFLGRGIFYSQERVGRGGKPFRIIKFRTMHPDRRSTEVGVPSERRNAHKADHDPRHTQLGRALRRMSLDELPQLWNVLKGDMSLVGPRPEILEIAEQRGYLDHVRHIVRPGMTGPYQLSDRRFNGDLRDGLDLDEEYVRRVTFRQDLKYLLKTFLVFRPANAGS